MFALFFSKRPCSQSDALMISPAILGLMSTMCQGTRDRRLVVALNILRYSACQIQFSEICPWAPENYE